MISKNQQDFINSEKIFLPNDIIGKISEYNINIRITFINQDPQLVNIISSTINKTILCSNMKMQTT